MRRKGLCWLMLWGWSLSSWETSILLFFIEENQAGAWRQGLMQRPWRCATHWFIPYGLLSLISYRSQDHHTPVMETPRTDCVLPHQSLIKKISYRQILWRYFLNWGSLLSDDSSLCHVDIKLVKDTHLNVDDIISQAGSWRKASWTEAARGGRTRCSLLLTVDTVSSFLTSCLDFSVTDWSLQLCTQSVLLPVTCFCPGYFITATDMKQGRRVKYNFSSTLNITRLLIAA